MNLTEIYAKLDNKAHPGLLWRFGGSISDATKDSFRRDQVNNVCAAAQNASLTTSEHGKLYNATFKRRERWLAQRATLSSLTIDSRLFTGLGEAGVFEMQAAMHPVTGFPRLVGSGIKGALRAWCYERLAAMEIEDPANATPMRANLLALFGAGFDDEDMSAGAMIVHDAWWCPESTRRPLEPEVDTPHHSDYYRPGGHNAPESAAPSDSDSPEPNPQLGIAGRMLFAIDHHRIGRQWAEICIGWLAVALAENGAGARTNVGYGRFSSASEST